MSAYARVPLGAVCEVNPPDRDPWRSADRLVSFVPMASVDERLGAITVLEDKRVAEVSKGYTAFRDGDVLFARITPCMENGKTALARNLTNGVGRGSTEFYVLRPGSDILAEYLHHVVRSASFRDEAASSFTGTAGQQRVPRSFMEKVLIPLPPLADQRRLVGIMDRVSKVERLRTEADRQLREFAPALFVCMFGDPVANPRGWRQGALGEVCEVQGGLQVSTKRVAHTLEAPYLRVANVLRDRLVLQVIKHIRLTQRELDRVRLEYGDLLLVEGHGNAAEIGRVAIWDASIEPCVHQNHLIRARPCRTVVLPEFACGYLNSASGRLHLLRCAKTTSGLNTITTSDVKACPIFLPPLDLQWRYARAVDAVRAAARLGEVGSRTGLALSSSLMSRLLEGDA